MFVRSNLKYLMIFQKGISTLSLLQQRLVDILKCKLNEIEVIFNF